MIVGIQSGGIGKVDMSQTGGTTDKSKSKDKASGTFEDLMNLAATNPNTTTQTANSATMKNDVDAVKQADTTVSGEKKQSDLNKYTRSDAKTETTRTTGAEKAKRNEAPQEVESDDLKAELLSNKLKKLLNVDDETLQNLLQTAGLAAAGGQFGITAAYYHAPAKEISIYDYSQIIFSTILGFFLFGQVPDRYSVLGYVIICAMALWMFVYNKNRE